MIKINGVINSLPNKSGDTFDLPFKVKPSFFSRKHRADLILRLKVAEQVLGNKFVLNSSTDYLFGGLLWRRITIIIVN